MGKKPGPKKGEGGAPEKMIDWKIFESLCSLQCTQAEILSVLNVDNQTLTKHVKKHYGKTYSQVYEEKRQGGLASIRRAQYKKAMAGDTTMLIWIGKNWLDQKDNRDVNVNTNINQRVTIDDNSVSRVRGWIEEVTGERGGEDIQDPDFKRPLLSN